VTGWRALMYFSVNFDGAAVGIVMGTHALGLYQFATRAAELPVVTFTRAIAQVALPAFSGDRASGAPLRETWRTVLGWVLAVNGAAAMAIVLFGDDVVRMIAGERWLPAVPLLRILAVAMVFRAVIVLTGQLLDAVGEPALTLRLNAVRFVALLVVLPLLAAYGGLNGVAQAVLVATAGAALLAGRFSARVLSS
jgi:teichuronic acid exporter